MRRFIKFCIVGGINTAITFCVYYLLAKIIGINYLLSSFVGYATGTLNSFILNKKWTFEDKENRVTIQLLEFTFVNLTSFGVNLFMLYTFVETLNIDKVVSQIFAMFFSTVVNYIGSKIIVFRRVNPV